MIRLTSEQMFSELIRTRRPPSQFSVSQREVPNVRGYVVSTMNFPVLRKRGMVRCALGTASSPCDIFKLLAQELALFEQHH